MSTIWPFGAKPAHPYYPLDAQLVSTYVPNKSSPTTLVTLISSAFAVVILGSWGALKLYKPQLLANERWIAVWFILCGVLHTTFEAYFVSNFTKIAAQQNIVAELWKEYALADSRYLTDDAGVFSLEAISVFVLGPLSLLTAYMTVTRDPRRQFLQTVVSVTHLYGVVIYYFSSLVDIVLKEQSHCRPEARYVWGYFIGGNIPWLIIPACILYSCMEDSRKSSVARKSKKSQ